MKNCGDTDRHPLMGQILSLNHAMEPAMSRRRARNRNTVPEQLLKPKAEQLFNPYAPIEALDAESLELIHDASMRILEDIGLEILNEKALALWEQDGARVDWDTQRYTSIATSCWKESQPFPRNLRCTPPTLNVTA